MQSWVEYVLGLMQGGTLFTCPEGGAWQCTCMEGCMDSLRTLRSALGNTWAYKCNVKGMRVGACFEPWIALGRTLRCTGGMLVSAHKA
jgi:hypothetical protein